MSPPAEDHNETPKPLGWSSENGRNNGSMRLPNSESYQCSSLTVQLVQSKLLTFLTSSQPLRKSFNSFQYNGFSKLPIAERHFTASDAVPSFSKHMSRKMRKQARNLSLAQGSAGHLEWAGAARQVELM